MMFSSLDLFQLPYISLAHLDKLPSCSGIYFAIDSENRLLYIGKADNLIQRWKSHHRWHQLNDIHQKAAVRIAWLVWTKEDLASVESYLIKRYQPLLNGTKVKIPETIPSEIILIELLQKIRNLIVVTGIKKATSDQLTTVYCKYNYENSGKNGCFQTIKTFIQEHKERASNLKIKRTKYGLYIDSTYSRRPGSREHKTLSRLQSSYNNHWEIACNGVIIDLTPTHEQEFKLLRSVNYSNTAKLAGVKIKSVNPKMLNSSLEMMIDDPIPLLWKNYTYPELQA